MKQRKVVDFFLKMLNPALWKDSPLGRSSECTPLFIERYVGPRQYPHCTSHDFWDLTAVISGHGWLETHEALSMRPSSVYLIPPGISHREKSDDILDTLWIGLRGTRLNRLDAGTILNVHDVSLVRQIEQLWMFAQKTMEPIGPELDAALAGVVARFLRLVANGNAEGPADHIDRAIRIMMERIVEPISIRQLATQVGCSEGYFQRTFRHRTGKTPVAFLTNLRLQQACHLLNHTRLTMGEIAERTGFSSLYYFSRLFHRHIGMCPTRYREAGEKMIRKTR